MICHEIFNDAGTAADIFTAIAKDCNTCRESCRVNLATRVTINLKRAIDEKQSAMG